MDFVHDQLATGTKLRVLTIVDTFSRFSPALEPRFYLPRRRCRRGPGKSWANSRIAGNDPGRPRHRVCITRSGSVGLPARSHARLLPARQADRQRVHRGLQWSLQSGMSERTLVPEPCRRPRKRWRIGASTTTKNARMGRSGKRPRLCCSITLAQPARHREKSRKTLASGDPEIGSQCK